MPDPQDDPTGDLADDLALALRIADGADAVTTARFRSADLVVTDKPDLTPVSDADLAVERGARALLARGRPDDAVLGEEYGGAAPARGRAWVIDPVDGTKSFVRGVPVWATLVALLRDGVPVVGVVSAPALGRRWWASTGGGAWVQELERPPRRLRVSAVADLTAASLGFSSLGGWRERGLLPAFLDLTEAVWRVRGHGDFFSYCLVAEGAVDVAAEPEVSLWDLAALDVLVREAGGTFTGLDGTPGPGRGDAVATNGTLHDAVLAALTQGGPPRG